MLRRALQRENIVQAYRFHLYQRLVIAGYSQRAVTLLYVGLALAGVAGSCNSPAVTGWRWVSPASCVLACGNWLCAPKPNRLRYSGRPRPPALPHSLRLGQRRVSGPAPSVSLCTCASLA